MIRVWYFAFHAPSGWDGLRGRASIYSIFGHVEAFGYTDDETWLFFDPQGKRTVIHVAHRHDEVSALMAERWAAAETIYRIEAQENKLFPLHPTMNCVSQCAALLGWRAYVPATFRRKLLRNGAEIIHGPSREPRGQGRARA